MNKGMRKMSTQEKKKKTQENIRSQENNIKTYNQEPIRTNTYPTKQKANLALALSAIGLLVAFPFQSTFWGGLFTSGCGAALVGGLADWFAVNALFRRPLGIPNGRIIRTEIIPRNREKIFRALSTMVEEELLPQEALKEKLRNYDYLAPIVSILSSPEREKLLNYSQNIVEHLIQHLQPLLQDHLAEKSDTLRAETLPAENTISAIENTSLALENIALEVEKDTFEQKKNTCGLKNSTLNTEVLAVELEALLKKDEFQEKLTYHLEKALRDFLQSEEGEKFLRDFIFTLKFWIEDTEVHFWLTHWFEDSIERYIARHPSRRILAIFLPSPSELAQLTQTKIGSYLREGEAIEGIKAWLEKVIEEAFHPKLLKGSIHQPADGSLGKDKHSEGVLDSKDMNSEGSQSRDDKDSSESTSEHITVKVTKSITDYIIRYLQTTSKDKLREEKLAKSLQDEFTQRIDKTLTDLQDDLLKRHTFNTQFYNLLLPLIERKHNQIKVMIYEGLQGYSGEELTELIESKAGDDLQMIRINGSIIGGLVGILIYLVNGIFI